MSPSSGLVGGQRLRVRLTGFPGDATVEVYECADTSGSRHLCAAGASAFLVTSSTGRASGPFVAQPAAASVPNGTAVPCRDQCELAALVIKDGKSPVPSPAAMATARLSFATTAVAGLGDAFLQDVSWVSPTEGWALAAQPCPTGTCARLARTTDGGTHCCGGQKPCGRIVRGLFAALSDHAGVLAHRAGALERVQLLVEDWQHAKARLADTEQPMTTVLDEIGLTALVTSVTGLSAVGAAAILAETGDPCRFATARALVKHAGLAPRENLSGASTGRTKLTGQGRPGLRLAAWRAVWAAQRANPVCGARYQYLTSREHNKLTPTQAQTVIAAAILRQVHAVTTTGQAWDPVTAAHGTQRHTTALAA